MRRFIRNCNKFSLLVLAIPLCLALTGCGDWFDFSDSSSSQSSSSDSSGSVSSNSGSSQSQSSGNGGAGFEVYNQATLQKVGTGADGWTKGAQYRQTGNITLSGNWTPLASTADPFTGDYDGGGYTISGLTVSGDTANPSLFGAIGTNGTVKNLALTGVLINSTGYGGYVGGIAGRNYGTIQNCSVTGSVSGYNNVGGIAGLNEGTVAWCRAAGSVQGSSSIGGIVGRNYQATVEFCAALNTVTSTGFYAGGIVGNNSSNNANGAVRNCYAAGPVTGESRVGGVVGINASAIVYCYAIGAVEAESLGGGVSGANDGTIQNCAALNPSVTRVGTGSATMEYRDNFGRVAGVISAGASCQNNYARSAIPQPWSGKSWGAFLPTNINGADASTASPNGGYNSQAFWTSTMGFNLTTVWQMGTVNSQSLPVLRNMP